MHGLDSFRDQVQEFKQKHQDAILKEKEKAEAAAEWNRYRECRKTPDPKVQSELNDFYTRVTETSYTSISQALQAVEVVPSLTT